ncbi:YegS/Rv2252/BmrU family lipid kinase [Hazenella coriacea]|uniref:Diacylglycerol kinase (ATP) n=1 Tax=Hazenella coriacea TaxID=1179467 RepID=A0A4R3L9G7_9BACL|nr:YegS/Rv2252/BmrU family lipid kinase [Hazenella coriacea]TCS95868.1 diacylglycerol kinase (ATP) [Hazenella coriacea]
MPRARLIYNPFAGKELVEKQLSKILDCLEHAGYETSCCATQGMGHATKEAAEAAKRGFEVVIAAGGDGTIHEVINGLAPFSQPPKLGILPAGTTNDFARALRLPSSLRRACEVIATGQTKRIDLGQRDDRYFINVAAAGRITEVTYEAPHHLKALMGPLAYYAKAAEKLGRLNQPFSVQLKTPRTTWTEEIMLLIIANSASVGGFVNFAPDADLSDGKLDVIIVPKTTIPELLQLVALAYKGEHLSHSRLIYFQTEELEIATTEPLKLNLDGEWRGNLSGRYTVLPKHLEVFVPYVPHMKNIKEVGQRRKLRRSLLK